MRRDERPPASSRSSSVHAPAAPATCRARRTQRLAALLVDGLDLAGAAEAGHPHARGDVRAVRRRGARDHGDHPRVVLQRVVELHGADERVGPQRGRLGQRAAAGSRWRCRGTERAPPMRVVEQSPAPRYARSQPRPRSGHRNGTGETRWGASASAAARARAAPRARARCRPSRGSAARRGSACSTRSRSRPRGRAPRRARPAARAWRRRAPRPRR